MVPGAGFEPAIFSLQVRCRTNLAILASWSRRRGLNPQQSAWKAEALPIELLLHKMARVQGYAPCTSVLETDVFLIKLNP